MVRGAFLWKEDDMSDLEALRQTIADHSKDQKINLQNVLKPGALSTGRTWGTAIACAAAAKDQKLTAALVQQAEANEVAAAFIDDARAAASLMAMNNVYYRFKHFMGDDSAYTKMPAKLRMMRIARPASDKLSFELFCLAVSAIGGCEMCVKAHEKTLTEGGVSAEEVHDAVRIAAVINAVATALTL